MMTRTSLLKRIDAGCGELLDCGGLKASIAQAEMAHFAQPDITAPTVDLERMSQLLPPEGEI